MTNKDAMIIFTAIMKRMIDNFPSQFALEIGINGIDDILELHKIVIDALEKADKYKWHDLSENPDDLPEANRWGESNYVLVKALIKVECFACNDMRKAYYSHTQKKWSIDGHVFAWRYIEPFKDEECRFWDE